MRGQLVELVLHRSLLRGNHLGTRPTARSACTWRPATTTTSSSDSPASTCSKGAWELDMWSSRTGFRRTDVDLPDELFSDHETPPCRLVSSTAGPVWAEASPWISLAPAGITAISATRRCQRWTPTSAPWSPEAPGYRRQVEWRLPGHGDPAAPTRPARRAGEPAEWHLDV